MKARFFPLLLVVCLLFEPIVYSLLDIMGMVSQSGQLRVFTIIIVALSWLFYFPVVKAKDFLLWSGVIIFGVLMYCTYAFRDGANDLFFSHFYRWGSVCLSFVALGLSLGRRTTMEIYKGVLFVIPLFSIPLTIYLTYISINGISSNSQFVTDSGFSYQTISYYMALLFGLNSYCLLNRINKSYFRLIPTAILVITMLFNILVSFMSGGRGGAVLTILYGILFIYFVFSDKKTNHALIVLGSLVFFLVFYALADKYNITTAAGFSRTFNYLEYDNRTALWNSCLQAFNDAPILGHGLGSDFYLFGYYTHNILIDTLVETGIVGTFFILTILLLNGKKVYSLSKTNQLYYLLLIPFFYAIVLNLFSGYWISTQFHWLILGFSFSFFTKH